MTTAPERERFAYLAGVIDSDGTIGIKRSTYAMRVRGDASQPTYSERVALRQVRPEAVALLRELFGGSVYMTPPSGNRGLPLHTWTATDQVAARCLVAIRPWLRLKGEQANNALALRAVKDASKIARVAIGRGHAGASARPVELGDEMERLYLRAKELNHVGI